MWVQFDPKDQMWLKFLETKEMLACAANKENQTECNKQSSLRVITRSLRLTCNVIVNELYD